VDEANKMILEIVSLFPITQMEVTQKYFYGTPPARIGPHLPHQKLFPIYSLGFSPYLETFMKQLIESAVEVRIEYPLFCLLKKEIGEYPLYHANQVSLCSAPPAFWVVALPNK